ncbi:diadenosine tetraphosphate hydrolase [Bacillus carboniphilus]|uniref:Diadenosine tetraphosphate hydrolase n=1 Tax=Bacillus carboniphilus TaxID=86663 RepID=A0ABY9JXL6_9BACI|nr:diadenosine tetraphosphate hydrolase [Bacillus carboniphilus]WLR42406.1 diadenosine tetraphosphate hydrolase [Bacillus carboniphilus]
MREITLSDGKKIKVECLSCAIAGGIVEPDGGKVMETEFFHAHQDVIYPIRGLVILTSKRHVKGFDELTEREKSNYIDTLSKIRKAQRNVLGIENVYYFYNEDTPHHFHTWMIPRYDWMTRFGRSVESVKPVLQHARVKLNHEKNVQKVKKP